MDYFSLILIAFSLSFDSFAASVCSGLSMCRKSMLLRDVLKIALTMAVVQSMLLVVGWLLGSTVKESIEHIDHWIAFGLLLVLGAHMIYDSTKPQQKIKNPTKWNVLLPIAVATSIDALAMGVSFAFFIANILIPALIIGFITLFVSISGFYMGRKAGKKLAGKAGIAGGIILILIGIKILLEHTLLA